MSRSYSVNGLNQITQMVDALTTNVTHDARGNTTAIGTASYGYSPENMLTSAPGGATLAYDPALRLYQVAGASTTRFLYDGPDMIAEYNGSNVLQRRFVHGPGADEPLVWYEGPGTSDRRFLHADERGSIVAISNGSGTVTNVNSYDEYGVPAAGNVGRFQYTGQKWIAEAGLYDYKARMYHPTLGRFMQTDPIGYASGMNLYAYVQGDPVNFSDPSGLLRWCVRGGGTPGIRDQLFCFGTHDADRLSGGLSSWRPSGDPSGRGTGGNSSNPMNWPHGERPPERTCSSAIAQVTAMSRIAAYAGSPLEQRFLRKYAAGDTSPYRLSAGEFGRAATWIEARIASSQHVYNESSNRTGAWSATINFAGRVHNEEFNFALGQATGYFQGNRLVGLSDTFEFQDRSYGSGVGGSLIRWGVSLAESTIAAHCPNANPAGFPVTGGTGR